MTKHDQPDDVPLRRRLLPFDEQASTFHARTGLPSFVVLAVADAFSRWSTPEGLFLDWGAGTGELGRALIDRFRGYVALDSSREMLRQARRALPARAPLIEADADDGWPFESSTVSVAFFSRSFHLLTGEHVMRELERVGKPGARLVIGTLERDHDGPGARLRQALHERLAARGHEPRAREGVTRFLDDQVRRGRARRWGPERVASMSRTLTLSRVFEQWGGKRGLGGLDLSEPEKRDVLAELRSMTVARLGDLDAPYEETRCYVLDGLALPV